MSATKFYIWTKKFSQEANTHPIILPKPILSFAVGRNLFMMLDCSNLLSHGITVTRIMTGTAFSVVAMYLWTSESVARSPNGFPKAMLDIVSRVKYVVVRPKSRGLNSELVERYFLPIRSTNDITFWSIDFSRFSTSFPEYYEEPLVINHHRGRYVYSSCHLRFQDVVLHVISLRYDIITTWIKSHANIPVWSLVWSSNG